MPLFFLYAAIVTGCATPDPAPVAKPATPPRKAPPSVSAPASRYNLTGYNAAFKQGYADACARKRDSARFKQDVDYQMGWNDGNSLCRR